MKGINTLLILVALVFSAKSSAQHSLDQALESVITSVTQVETSTVEVSTTLRSSVIRYIYRRPINTNVLLSVINEKLAIVEEYSDEISLYANQAEEITNNALKLSVIKDLSSDIEATGDALEVNANILTRAIATNNTGLVYRSYNMLYQDLIKVLELSEEIKDFVNAIDTKIYATYNVRIRLVDATGNELPAYMMESYVATNLATQEAYFSDEDIYVEGSGYLESSVFRTLSSGIYTFKGIAGTEIGEISNRQVFVEESLVDDEGYIVITFEFEKSVPTYDVQIKLVDTNGNEVPPFVLPGYKVLDTVTGDIVYDNQNEPGTIIGLISDLPQGTYDFMAYSGISDAASTSTVTLTEDLINEEGYVVVTLQYRPITSTYTVKIRLEDRNGNEVAVSTLLGYVATNVINSDVFYEDREVGIFNGLAAGTYRFDAYDGYFDGASSKTVTLSDDILNEEGFIIVTLQYWSE